MSWEAWGDGDDGWDWSEQAMEAGWVSPDEISGALRDVMNERIRQVTDEGFTAEHDDDEDLAILAHAATCYALWSPDSTPEKPSETPARAPDLWPWDPAWFKPTHYRRDLVKATALLIAEIERLDRREARAGQ
jgi:hypothetical protein